VDGLGFALISGIRHDAHYRGFFRPEEHAMAKKQQTKMPSEAI
jgi:hypothetical protein